MKRIDAILKRIHGFRKWTFGLAIVAASSVFLVTKYISGDNFQAIAVAALAGFMAGNIGERALEAAKELWREKTK